MTKVKNPAGNKSVNNPLESEYEFKLKYESGKKKTILIRRVTTGDKLRFGMFIRTLTSAPSGNVENDMAFFLYEMLCPEILTEVGDTPTYDSLAELTMTIFEKDGKTLFGENWESVSDKMKKSKDKAKN